MCFCFPPAKMSRSERRVAFDIDESKEEEVSITEEELRELHRLVSGMKPYELTGSLNKHELPTKSGPELWVFLQRRWDEVNGKKGTKRHGGGDGERNWRETPLGQEAMKVAHKLLEHGYRVESMLLLRIMDNAEEAFVKYRCGHEVDPPDWDRRLIIVYHEIMRTAWETLAAKVKEYKEMLRQKIAEETVAPAPVPVSAPAPIRPTPVCPTPVRLTPVRQAPIPAPIPAPIRPTYAEMLMRR